MSVLSVELGADDVIGPGGGWLYESPLWDHRRHVFLWVDIEAGDVHELEPVSGRLSVHRLNQTVACIALRSGGGYVVALRHSIAVTDETFGSVEVVCDLPELADDVRFNDGAVAPDGAFWAGTLSHSRAAAGVLYRVGADHHAVPVLEGVSTSNGMDWSPGEGRHLYVDSGPGTIDVLHTAPTDDGGWSVQLREPFYRTTPAQGSPDGLTIDSTGHAWVALWGSGRVVRLSPDGEIVAEVKVPAPHTSSIAFGGADLRDLYITTAREDLDEDELAEFPLSGSVFRWRSEVTGRPSSEWQG